MSSLYVINATPRSTPVTLAELLAMLSPEKLDRIERDARVMREAYPCPYVVRDYDAFKYTIADFFAHYEKAIHGADYFRPDNKNRISHEELWRVQAAYFLEQHIGSYPGGRLAAQRNAITGREGGLIGVLDALTEGIIKAKTDQYIRYVFYELVAEGDYDLRLRLAQELLNRYGKLLFPNEELQPVYYLGFHLEEVIRAFIGHVHALRREWRR